jgi:AraC family transcriptional regulator
MLQNRRLAGLTIDEVQPHLLRIFPLKATSSGRSWEGIQINEYGGVFIDDLRSPPRDHVKISLNTGTAAKIRREACGKTFVSPSRIGDIAILPAARKSRWHGWVPAHLDIRLVPEKVDEMAAELRKAGHRTFEFADVPSMRDPVIEHIGAIFRIELNRASHPAQEIVIESLALALCAHMLRSYTNATGIEDRSTASIDSAAIRRAITYVESHPDRAISLRELAGAAGLSRFHFGRVFKRHTGVSPARYVEQARIAQAKLLIVSAELSLAAVAHTVGFADQSHFTRRFRAHEGCTPAQFAREHGQGHSSVPLGPFNLKPIEPVIPAKRCGSIALSRDPSSRLHNGSGSRCARPG